MSQPRLPVVVRDATPEDAAALIELWNHCITTFDRDGAEGGAVVPMWREPVVAEAASAIASHTADVGRRLFVALLDGDIVGVVAVAVRGLTPIHTTKTVVVSDLHIAPRRRRKRVASTLMSAAVNWAEEQGCELVLTTAPVASRDAHRFLTRLGFCQVSIVRGAQVSVLRSRFVTMATSSAGTGRLIAVRRALRRHERALPSTRPGL